MTNGKPIPRVGLDWDDDGFICYDCLVADALNNMHSGLSADQGAINLHWLNVNKSGINSATVSFQQEFTAYGLRKLHCVTGTNTTAGAYFGRTGSSNDFIVSNAHTYTAVFWIKASVGSGVGFTFLMENSSGSQTFNISSSWQKISRTFTTTGTTSAFKITKTNSATDVTFDVAGFMIVDSSSAPSGFNVGHPTNRYDVLRAESIDLEFGKHQWEDAFPVEGKASVQVSNASRTYSPEYSGGPLFGYIKQRLLLTVDILKADGVTYVRKFAGWTRPLQPEFGKNRTKKITIEAEQGVFRLKEMRYAPTVGATTTADAIIAAVIARGLLSAVTPLQAPLGRARLGAAYLAAPADLMSLNAGVSEITPTGEEWGLNATSEKVLRDVMEVEEGHFFIGASGQILFYNRKRYSDPATTPATTPILDAAILDGQYVYSKAYQNQVQVNYKPPSTRTGIIWSSRGSLLVKGQNGKFRRERQMDVRFEYEEGKKMTVTAVNPFNDGSPDESTYVAETAGGVDITELVSVRFETLENGGGRLHYNNAGMRNAYMTIILKGTIQETYGGERVEVSDPAPKRGGVFRKEVAPKLIHDKADAENLANHLLAVRKDAFGQFESLSLVNKGDTGLDRILDLGQGSKISLNEYQTGHSGTYIVIGEKHRWQPGRLATEYKLHPHFRTNKYWIIGTSTIGTDTYAGY